MKEKINAGTRIEKLKLSERSIDEDLATLNKAVYDRIMAQTQSDPQVVRLAKSLAAFLHERNIMVFEDELFAGHTKHVDCKYSHPYANVNEVNALLSGPNACLISKEDRMLAEKFLTGTRIGLYSRWPSGHVIGGYEKVINNGLNSKIEMAKAILSGEEKEKKEFAYASLIVCEAARDYILRYAARARELADKSTMDEDRKQLERIANACEWVSVNPARNFFEAVQLLWLTHEVITCEQTCGSLSLGRLDQYLYPFYCRDLAAGTITYEEASELVEALWIKFSGLIKGYQNVTLGGVDKDGNYAVNDLTYICLRATKKLRMDQPLISVRWHKSMPEDLWKEIQELIETGLGFPALFNDEVCIAAKQRLGVSKEDAINYGIVGCVELSVPGREYAHTEGFRINWAKVLELIFNNGVCTFTGEKMGLKDNRGLENIKSFEEFYMWFREELTYFLDLALRAINLFDANYKNLYPTPFLSSFMDGCLENGADVTAGATVYNFTSVNAVGMANAVDSLAAIRKFVFEDTRAALPKLSEILITNFEGLESLRKELVLKYSKYGNDHNETDIIMKELTNDFCQYVDGFSNPRNGRFQSGLYTFEAHASLGKLTGAMPDGRLKGTSLANGLSPVQGADILGPTAVIKSTVKLDHRMLGNGMVLDLKFHPTFFENNKHRQAFKYMVETYFELGGMEIQFNVVSRETLLKAQNSPEEYRDLIVRVSGFSAYFVTLDKVLQDEIIARTEYSAM